MTFEPEALLTSVEAEHPGDRGHARRVTRNFLALSVGDVVTRLGSFLVLALVARRLGPEALGWLATGQLVAILAPAIVDFGISVVSVRAVSQHLDTPGPAFARAVGVRTAIATVFAVSVVAAVVSLPMDPEVALVAVAFIPFLYSIAFDPALIYQSNEELRPLVLIRTTGVVVYAAVAFVAVLEIGDVVAVAVAFTLAHAIGTAIALVDARRRFRVDLSRPTLKGGRDLCRVAAPVGIAFLCSTVALTIGVFFLALTRDAAAVGQYNAALRVFILALAPSYFFVQSMLPRLSATWLARPDHFVGLVVGASRVLGTAVWLMVVVGFLFAPYLTQVLYGPDFGPAGAILAVLSLALGPAYLAAMLQPAMIAAGGERRYLGAMVSSVIPMTVCSAILAVAYGAIGVAWAVVAGFVILAVISAARPSNIHLRRSDSCLLVASGSALSGLRRGRIRTPSSLDMARRAPRHRWDLRGRGGTGRRHRSARPPTHPTYPLTGLGRTSRAIVVVARTAPRSGQ